MTRPLVTSLLLVGALAGCTEDTREARFELTRLGSCADVRERIRAQAIANMEARLAAERARALKQECSPFVADIEAAGVDDAADNAGGGTGGSRGDDGPRQTSGTNNQVAGVDEADFVKAVDGYLYIANAGKLRIIDAWPPEQAHVVSETPIEGETRKLFVYAGRAIVYSSLGEPPAGAPHRECTYGYSCSFVGDGRPTKVTVLDLGDLASPRVIREIRLTGSLLAARRIGNGVHTVVSEHAPGVANLAFHPAGIGSCTSNVAKMWAFERLRRKNLALLESSDFDLYLPSAIDSADGELGNRCDQFYGADVGDGSEITSVLSLDVTAAHGGSFASIVSRPGAIYGSADALYMAVPRSYEEVLAEESAIHKLAITAEPLGVEYRGTGRVPGHVLSQLAMDEHEGALRVATTVGGVPFEGTSSSLTVLREQNGALETVGSVDNIAPHEDIRSVRFAGRRGFVVTFKKTDPLYVFDLARPEAPSILGELEIPGFSTYMHMLDDTHLLTIGYDADDQGSFAWFAGVLLQIFDVTDPRDPQLAHKHVIGTRGSSSEALTNHLAFTYFAPKQALGLPMTVCQGGQPPSYGALTFSGLMVFRATAEAGFAELGRVTHPPGPNIDCGNWWTEAESQVRRSVFMDDYVFSISGTTVKANALANLPQDLVTIPIDQ